MATGPHAPVRSTAGCAAGVGGTRLRRGSAAVVGRLARLGGARRRRLDRVGMSASAGCGAGAGPSGGRIGSGQRIGRGLQRVCHGALDAALRRFGAPRPRVCSTDWPGGVQRRLGLLRDLLHVLLELGQLGLAHRLVELGAELLRVPPDDAHVLADRAQQHREVLRADDEQRHDREQQQLAGGDVEHRLPSRAQALAAHACAGTRGKCRRTLTLRARAVSSPC